MTVIRFVKQLRREHLKLRTQDHLLLDFFGPETRLLMELFVIRAIICILTRRLH